MVYLAACRLHPECCAGGAASGIEAVGYADSGTSETEWPVTAAATGAPTVLASSTAAPVIALAITLAIIGLAAGFLIFLWSRRSGRKSASDDSAASESGHQVADASPGSSSASLLSDGVHRPETANSALIYSAEGGREPQYADGSTHTYETLNDPVPGIPA